MGAAALAADAFAADRQLAPAGGSMYNFTVPPMSTIRVGVVGVGSRGLAAVQRICRIPGCVVTALCDVNSPRVALGQKELAARNCPAAKEYSKGPEDYKRLCDASDVDVVYSATPRELHCAINVYAMNAGKHVLQEVPGAFSLEECWQTVETAEKTRRHCMMLENCCYGENELLALNLVRQGVLGEIVQAEAGYSHDQRSLQYNPADGVFWRIKRHRTHHGNYYPTHGLCPMAKCLDINRGDRFEYLVSMETKSAGFEAFAAATLPEGDKRRDWRMVKGDINMTLIHTAKGRTISLTHNVSTPRPYDRGDMLLGTKGMFRAYPELMIAYEDRIGDGKAHAYFSKERTEEVRQKYMHPLWKAAGEVAKKVGGHGGMDFVMDLRWAFCLQNGLPLDTNVYDLAAWSSIVELSERSVNGRSAPVEVPDFTRGAWKTAKPFEIVDIDLAKMEVKI